MVVVELGSISGPFGCIETVLGLVGDGLCDTGLSKVGAEVEVETPAGVGRERTADDNAFKVKGPEIAGPDCPGEEIACCCCSPPGDVTLWVEA